MQVVRMYSINNSTFLTAISAVVSTVENQLKKPIGDGLKSIRAWR